MKRIVSLLALLIIMFNCGSKNKAVLGTWKTESGYSIKFYSNNTFSYNTPGDKTLLSGTFSFDNKEKKGFTRKILLRN